jgi:hypothetical protein
MIEKRVVRAIRPGEMFNPADLSNKATVEIPPGFDMMTIPINRDKMVGGFAVPGSKVDLIASVKLNKLGKSVVFPVLIDMMVLAVDTAVGAPQQGSPIANMTDVSVAVTKKQALMLHAMLGRTSEYRLILRGQDGQAVYDKIPTEEEIWKILGDEVDAKEIARQVDKKDEPEFKVVELPVPREELKAGTELTEELINSKFTVIKIVPPAPDNVISNVREHVGKFLQKDLAANQYVPRTFLGDTKPSDNPAPKQGKGAPSDGGTSPKASPGDEPSIPAGPPPQYWDVTVQTTGAVKKFRYQVLPGNEYKFLGEIKPEETPDAPAKPEKAPAEDGKKPEKLIRADAR